MSQAAYEAGPLLARTEVVDEVSPTLPRVESLRREVFDRSPLGIVESDLDRRVRYANQAALAMIGATEYQGLSLDQVFSDSNQLGAAENARIRYTRSRRYFAAGRFFEISPFLPAVGC